jgi:hypothetical protein
MFKFLLFLGLATGWMALAILEAFLYRYNALKDMGWYREDH